MHQPADLVLTHDIPASYLDKKQSRELILTACPPPNVSHLLVRAAASDAGLSYYTSEHESEPRRLSYAALQRDATEKASLLRSIDNIDHNSIILLHFDTQFENILWFWACILGGFIPAISTPFVADNAQRKKHLLHLQKLLNKPVILTTARLTPGFLDLGELSLYTVESLCPSADASQSPVSVQRSDDIAVLMLTSGSTGSAKAVPLRHEQLIAAVTGKSHHHGIRQGAVFLNWIGIDHVASLSEIHLLAMAVCGEQVHVATSEVLKEPLNFIRLLDLHKVVYTFAPNFFLTKLRDSIASAGSNFTANLTRLRALISGGESNVVTTCDGLTRDLRRFGVEGEVIRPGFGMTETCAGSIYSRACPTYDVFRKLEFASLGTCTAALSMRVVKAEGGLDLAGPGETGHLQVCGPALFDHYFNDPAATAEVFTADGWFHTGDLAYIDDQGCLNLVGRTKDTIIVNGVKWSSTEIEAAVEEEGIVGLVPSFTVVFPHRAQGSATEDICVVYAASYEVEDDSLRYETAASISKTISLVCGKNPDHLIPLPVELLEKSSLGKISRTKVRAAFEKGHYATFVSQDKAALARQRTYLWQAAETRTEKLLQTTLADLLGIEPREISMRVSLFELGVDSFNLITLQSMLQKFIDAEVDIPMSILLTEPSVGAVAAAIDSTMSQPIVYNPIVPLQIRGTKTPLFCIHPGSGDILVFIALAAHFSTRPVYAIRTRGYNPGERLFTSIQETADTYAAHIRETQPEGPYAIAGYSLGSTLAYEVGKVLEAQGQEVRFLASIDYPPYIRDYVRNLNWVDVVLHIALFLELIDEATMVEITPVLRAMTTREQLLAYVLEIGDRERASSLAIDAAKLELISNIAENFRVNVETYEPGGLVETLDVFVADPPMYAAKGRQDWRDNKLGRWEDFSRTETTFWDCPGIHAKMLNPQHMSDFAKIFKMAMKKRGV